MTNRCSIKGTVSTRSTMRGKSVPRTTLGRDGLSAYEIALKNGFEGTEREWLESLEAANPETVKDAVKEYLKENPVTVPVTSVNGETGDVKLTAEDIGAIAENELQTAVNGALQQAKESGEFNGKDGADGKDGKDGENGKDYVLTEADKTEIAAQAASLIDTALANAIGTGVIE